MRAPDGTLPSIPDDAIMRGLGCADHDPKRWFFSRPLLRDVFFTVSIHKETGDYWELVEDYAFGQPYYYMTYAVGEQVKAAIEAILTTLRQAGIDITVDHEQYRLETV